MKIAVLGATGRTGKLIVEEAILAGHSVRALARDPTKLELEHDALDFVRGDARDLRAVSRLVKGCDAVVSAVGPTQGEDDICTSATANVLSAMKEHKVRRYVLLSAVGVDMAGDNKALGTKLMGKLMRVIAGGYVADKEQELRLLQASDVEWTILRAPKMVDGEPTGKVQVSMEKPEASKIRRADLAKFAIAQLSSPDHVRRAPFITS